jgi:hypothetical protein
MQGADDQIAQRTTGHVVFCQGLSRAVEDHSAAHANRIVELAGHSSPYVCGGRKKGSRRHVETERDRRVGDAPEGEREKAMVSVAFAG